MSRMRTGGVMCLHIISNYIPYDVTKYEIILSQKNNKKQQNVLKYLTTNHIVIKNRARTIIPIEYIGLCRTFDKRLLDRFTLPDFSI